MLLRQPQRWFSRFPTRFHLDLPSMVGRKDYPSYGQCRFCIDIPKHNSICTDEFLGQFQCWSVVPDAIVVQFLEIPRGFMFQSVSDSWVVRHTGIQTTCKERDCSARMSKKNS